MGCSTRRSDAGRGLAIAITLIALVFSAWMFLEAWEQHRGTLHARHAAEKSMLWDLCVALRAYNADFGAYPPTGNVPLVRALSTRGPKGATYFDFPGERISPAGEWMDRWGKPFDYENAGASGFRVLSAGPDGVNEAGAGDDIQFEMP